MDDNYGNNGFSDSTQGSSPIQGVAMKKCPNCRADIEADSVFCEFCGSKVGAPTQVARVVDDDTEERPNNYLGKAIAGVILCWPFGFSGIINAAKVNSLWDKGQKEEAIAAADRARSASSTAIILGIIANVITFVYYFLVGMGAFY